MSMSVLLRGVKSYLATNLSLPDPIIGIRAKSGKPVASMGTLYYAVHPLRWYSGPSHGLQNEGSDEMFDVGVTITMRTGRTPDSKRMGVNYLGLASAGIAVEQSGLEPKMRAVVVSMTKGRYTGVLAAANALLSGDPFIEPLVLAGCDAEPNEVGPDWFNADPDDVRAYGWTMTAQFTGARRLQHLSTME